jgi:hypothetical protein
MFGLTPLWNPVLHYDTHRSRLFLFYCESRKTNSPGGDIKFITTKDLGITWTPPSTILSHEGIEEVPKVCSNQLVESSLDGTWYLPIHSEPRQSNEIFNTKNFSALNTVPDAVYTDASQDMLPPTAKKQSPVTWAGVIFSTDRGITWRLGGLVEDPHTWLIEPALHETQQGWLVMFCRSGAGKTYSCVSTDRGKSWTKPAPLPGGKTDLVKNPNSKVSLVTIDNQILMVHHPSSVDRSPLVLSLSVDDGRTWEQLAVLEGNKVNGGRSSNVGGGGGIMPSQASFLNNNNNNAAAAAASNNNNYYYYNNNNNKPNTMHLSSTTTTTGNPSSTMQYNADPKAVILGNAVNYSYPCITQWTEDTVKVVYTVWGEGLRMATATLATTDT